MNDLPLFAAPAPSQPAMRPEPGKRRAKTESGGPETPLQRIEHAANVTRGNSPMVLVFKTEAEAAEARRLLAGKRRWKNLSVKVDE